MLIKKTILHSLLLSSFLLPLSADTADINNLDFFKINNIKIDAHQEAKISSASLFHVRNYQKGDMFVLKTKDKTYLISGEVSEFKNKVVEPLYIKKDLTDLKSKALLKLGNGSKELIYFTNYECPACKMIHEQFQLLPNIYKDYTFYVIPIHFQNKRVPTKSETFTKKILLEDDNIIKQELFNKYMRTDAIKPRNLNRGSVSMTSLEEKIDNFNFISSQLGVKGTPTFLELDAKPFPIDNFLKK